MVKRDIVVEKGLRELNRGERGGGMLASNATL
jgi:hypothetical protein